MEIKHEFKGGYKVGESAFLYRLIVLSEDVDIKNAFRLAEAVDREYKQLLSEQFDNEGKGVFGQWQDSPLN